MKGAYVLLIRLEKERKIRVGSLGDIDFRAGRYCYVGSAYGPGGLEARISRHLRKDKRERWHIDHLLKYAEIEEVFVKEGGNEVSIAAELSEKCRGIRGFGASDSPLDSHLFICPDRSVLLNLWLRPYL